MTEWTILTTRNALADIVAITDWYAVEAPQEVARFLKEFEATKSRIMARPLLRREFPSGARHEQMDIYPHHVIYRVEEARNIIRIIGVLHPSRHPGTAASRR
jgi:plasmid stabilization system protein ParE